MRVLVTGGAGFIGSHIVDSLLARGHDVRVLDDFSSGHTSAVSYDGVDLWTGSVCDDHQVDAAVQGCDLVSHHAAQLEITKSQAHPDVDLTTNAVGTINVARACAKHGVKRLVVASSACVYGECYSGDEGHGVKETDATSPNWPYGVSKLAAEHYARLYFPQASLLRYSIVYGPREWYGRALTLFVRAVLNGHRPVVFGGGEQRRDLVHVSDVVAAHNAVLLNDTPLWGPWNVSSGTAATIEHLAETVCRVHGGGLTPQYENVREGEHGSNGRARLTNELQCMWLDPSGLHRTTGWRAKVSLDAGVRTLIDWARAHPDRWAGRMSY